nr:ParA family protein [Thiocapsa imhoffii]
MFWHRKGGTGKTSLAIGCACRFARSRVPGQRPRVLLIDTDPQGSAAAWGERYAEDAGLVVRADSGHDLWDRNQALLERFDRVLVDAAPSVTAETLDLLAGTDRLLIPTRPAWPDVWALEAVAELLADQDRAGHRLVARVVFNQVRDEALAPFAAALAEFGLQALPNVIPADPQWPALFRGGPPPDAVAGLLSALD